MGSPIYCLQVTSKLAVTKITKVAWTEGLHFATLIEDIPCLVVQSKYCIVYAYFVIFYQILHRPKHIQHDFLRLYALRTLSLCVFCPDLETIWLTRIGIKF